MPHKFLSILFPLVFDSTNAIFEVSTSPDVMDW